jgi:cystathionine gamma-lyase
MKFETRAIWVGQAADQATGATIVPIYQTSTFTQEEINKHKGYEYSRVGNPTRAALDECLASLKEGKYGLTFSSGMAEANIFFKKLKVIQLADSLGGVESLANYSALMTHEAYPPELRKKIGVTDNLIRLFNWDRTY